VGGDNLAWRRAIFGGVTQSLPVGVSVAEPVRMLPAFALLNPEVRAGGTSLVVSDVRAQRATRGLRNVEVALAQADRQADRRSAHTLSDVIGGLTAIPALIGAITFGMGGIVVLAAGVGAMVGSDPAWATTLIECLEGMGCAAVAMAPTVVAGGIPAVAKAVRGGAARTGLAARCSDELASVERATNDATSLERAWLATRAAGVLRSLDCSEVASPSTGWRRRFGNWIAGMREGEVIDRLRAFAALRGECNETDLRDAAAMHDVLAAVYVPGRELFPLEQGETTNAPTAPESKVNTTLSASLETMLTRLESMSASARLLIAPMIREAVVLQLDAEPGNRFRLRRFEEALNGTRSAYNIIADAPRGPSDSLRRGTVTSDPKQRAIDTLVAEIRGANAAGRRVDCGVWLDDAPSAEHVAAYVETLDYRASIFERDGKAYVAVYDPLSPPASVQPKSQALATT
jgi:hypothetical protein